MTRSTASRSARSVVPRDAGGVLPLVLVMSLVISLIVAALATYVATGLRFAVVVEERADRLAAADGGLRYAIERLGNSQYAACLSNLGNAGYTIDFPATVNGAEVEVTCTQASAGISDVKAWAIIVTGAGVPDDQPMLTSQSGGGSQKLLGGPIWISDPDSSRTDLKAPVTIEDGDVWYHRADCGTATLDVGSNLAYTPEFRGPICVDQPWDAVYDVPIAPNVPLAPIDEPPDTTSVNECSIFSPGMYTTAPLLTKNNYFKSGEYYFVDFTWDITDATVVAGWADSARHGDQQFLSNAPCAGATAADAVSGSEPGATFYLGGSSRIAVDNKGALEILRRRQADSFVSVQALRDTSAPYTDSTLDYADDAVWTKSGSNSDLALHGLAWAPYAGMTFGNVTNSANGQILGGAAFAAIHLQASASASTFIIRVESSPDAYNLLLKSVATLNGRSTTMQAVVQVDDQGNTAVNSIRVVE